MLTVAGSTFDQRLIAMVDVMEEILQDKFDFYLCADATGQLALEPATPTAPTACAAPTAPPITAVPPPSSSLPHVAGGTAGSVAHPWNRITSQETRGKKCDLRPDCGRYGCSGCRMLTRPLCENAHSGKCKAHSPEAKRCVKRCGAGALECINGQWVQLLYPVCSTCKKLKNRGTSPTQTALASMDANLADRRTGHEAGQAPANNCTAAAGARDPEARGTSGEQLVSHARSSQIALDTSPEAAMGKRARGEEGSNRSEHEAKSRRCPPDLPLGMERDSPDHVAHTIRHRGTASQFEEVAQVVIHRGISAETIRRYYRNLSLPSSRDGEDGELWRWLDGLLPRDTRPGTMEARTAVDDVFRWFCDSCGARAQVEEAGFFFRSMDLC